MLPYKHTVHTFHNTTDICGHLSTCGVQDARVSEVTGGPAGVNAVDLELRELKGGVKGFGADADHYGVHRQRDALHNLLRKTIFTGKERIRLQINKNKYNIRLASKYYTKKQYLALTTNKKQIQKELSFPRHNFYTSKFSMTERTMKTGSSRGEIQIKTDKAD